MFEYLFLDLDETILDFHKAEAVALRKALTEFGIAPTEEVCALYSRINKDCWHALERGELTRDQVRVNRFSRLMEALKLSADPKVWADCYEGYLSQGHWFLPGAYDALVRLSKKYRLFLATNGIAHVQEGRLESAQIRPLFEQIFISQEIGANKPSQAFFEGCFAKIPGFDREKCLMVGDSLSSDILGGQNAGIATCWVNPGHLPQKPGIRVDYEIESLPQLYPLLETL